MAGSRFQGYGMRGDRASFVVIHCAVCHPGVPVSRAGRPLLFGRMILPGLPLPSPSCLSSFYKGITGDWRSAGGGWYREIRSNRLLTSLLNKFTVGVPAPHSGGAQLLLLMMQFSAELRDCPKSCELGTYVISDQIVGQACSNHVSFLLFTYL